LKQSEYEKELAKLTEIFNDVDPSKAKLVEGLIQDAAFIFAENYDLKEIISKVGMIKVHPKYPDIQKDTKAGQQYLKNVNSYSVIIKTLNGILQKNALEGDDEFDEYIKQMHNKG
jgi:hypothetical protein